MIHLFTILIGFLTRQTSTKQVYYSLILSLNDVTIKWMAQKVTWLNATPVNSVNIYFHGDISLPTPFFSKVN